MPITRLLLFCLLAWPLVAVEEAAVATRLAAMTSGHPRLLLDRAGELRLKARLATEPLLAAVHEAVMAEATRLLDQPPVQRVLIGRRLLDKSRTCLSRVLHLGYAWRMSGEARHLERAKAELLAAAAFTDWNPSHFLDVAEMTAALAIGYDWLHAGLDEATRATLRTAIVAKGLEPSFGRPAESWWIMTNNNWNQVCHAGMVLGALALDDADTPRRAAILARAVNNLPRSMDVLAPDGAYPEGAGYWGYGITFNVLLIAALESALGTDFALAERAGFLPTADYQLHVCGPSGRYFNYADCGSVASVQPAMFWFAARRKQPYLLWNELNQLAVLVERQKTAHPLPADRLQPLLLAWASELPAQRPAPPALSWAGKGPMPVAFHRSAWTTDATYVGLKGGSPSVNHAHMDVGSFVVDADGLRWAEDLGAQNYESLESKQVKIWGMHQESQRWQVFRLGSFSHNILTVDGQQQQVKGRGAIVKHQPGRSVVDLGSVYQGQLAQAQRGAALLADRSVLIQDEIVADKAVTLRWAMLTSAEVQVTGPGRARLTQRGKAMRFHVIEPADAQVQVWSTDPPKDYDAPNPGTRLIGFHVVVPAGATRRLAVQLVPGAGEAAAEIRPLAEW
jgi:hypothetical protein